MPWARRQVRQPPFLIPLLQIMKSINRSPNCCLFVVPRPLFSSFFAGGGPSAPGGVLRAGIVGPFDLDSTRLVMLVTRLAGMLHMSYSATDDSLTQNDYLPLDPAAWQPFLCVLGGLCEGRPARPPRAARSRAQRRRPPPPLRPVVPSSPAGAARTPTPWQWARCTLSCSRSRGSW